MTLDDHVCIVCGDVSTATVNGSPFCRAHGFEGLEMTLRGLAVEAGMPSENVDSLVAAALSTIREELFDDTPNGTERPSE